MQSRLQSLIESASNIAIGYGVALASQILVFPLFGIKASLKQNSRLREVQRAAELSGLLGDPVDGTRASLKRA